jgi:hypothetical protein
MKICALISSPWIQVGRGVWALISILILLEVFKMIDVTTISTPEEYIPFMLASTLIMAILIGKLTNDTLYHKAVDNKIASGKIESAAELPQDNRYLFGTIVSMILAIGTGLFATAYLIEYIGIVGAGQWTYVCMSGLTSAVSVAVYILILHWGLREFLVRASDYVVSLADTVKESASKVTVAKETAEDINEIINDLKETVTTTDDQLP